MRQRRPAEKRDHRLAAGPGNLTRVMGISRELYGRDMTRGDFVVETPSATEPFDVTVTTRIGITKTADLPLRFLIRGHGSVSR
jgi:DNA-3-methyladenine glycosylase